MYCILKEESGLNRQDAALLLKAFNTVTRRLQQIVVLSLATAKTELQITTSDILTDLMREAGRSTVRSETFQLPSPVLSVLDDLIIQGLKAEAGGLLQIGTAPVYFQFKLEFNPSSLSLNESLVCSEAHHALHHVFFEHMDELLGRDPHENPVDTLKQFHYA